MKKLFYIYILSMLIFDHTYGQQNLIPNPGFETYNNCPSFPGNISELTNWFPAGSSADYFNACAVASQSYMSVPYNWAGYQPAATGNAYAGFVTDVGAMADYREFIGNTLTTSLTVGAQYFISFKVCMTNNAEYTSGTPNSASNKIGAKFSKMPYSMAHPPAINNSANFFTNTIISDSVNWTQISGSFIADSAYKYITIGNFFDHSHTLVTKFGTNNDTVAYYFIDDVSLTLDTTFIITNLTNQSIDNPIKIYPNPCSDHLFIEMIKPTDLIVRNCFGKEILRRKNIAPQKLSLDVSPWESGMYFITVNEKTYRITIDH